MSVYRGETHSRLKAINAEVDTLSATTMTVTNPPVLPTYTVASVPAAASYTGALIYVSNGAAGNPVVAFSDGTDWLRVDTLAAVAAA